jgi:hypothetical protein
MNTTFEELIQKIKDILDSENLSDLNELSFKYKISITVKPLIKTVKILEFVHKNSVVEIYDTKLSN